MQLSLPVSTFPLPAVSNAGSGAPHAPTDQTAKNSDDSSGDCFESMLTGDDSSGEPVTEEEGTEAEKAAALLTALLWMPAVQATPPPPPTALAVTSVTPTSADSATEPVESSSVDVPAASVDFTFKSSRAFTSALAKAQTQAAASMQPEPIAAEPVLTPEVTAVPVAPEATEELGETQVVENPTSLLLPGEFTPKPALVAGSKRPLIVASTSLEAPAKGLAVSATAPKTENIEVPLVVPTTEDSPVAVTSEPAAKPVPVQEKIAALPPVLEEAPKTAAVVREKYFLGASDKGLTATNENVGISVAKVNAVMPSATPARTKSASISESTTAFSFSADTASVATLLTPDAPAPVATVRETMAAVISAVEALERRADVQQKSVDLQFNVGSEKLGLRVELRDGVVHTTFRTESSEMNGALAREWHAVVQPAAAREIRLADPVFSSSGNSSFGSLGQGSSQQREQPAPASFSSALKREFYDSGISESAPTASPAVNSSQLLNALA